MLLASATATRSCRRPLNLKWGNFWPHLGALAGTGDARFDMQRRLGDASCQMPTHRFGITTVSQPSTVGGKLWASSFSNSNRHNELVLIRGQRSLAAPSADPTPPPPPPPPPHPLTQNQLSCVGRVAASQLVTLGSQSHRGFLAVTRRSSHPEAGVLNSSSGVVDGLNSADF